MDASVRASLASWVVETALGGMSAEQRNATMNTLFGSDAVRAASVLYEQGAAGIEAWETKVADAGYASRVAAVQTDNLAGDVERLGGSLETALIGSGSAANGVLRALTQTADGALGVFSDMPGPVQGAATGVGALAGAASLASGAFLLGAPKVAAFKDALKDMGPRSQQLGGALLKTGGLLAGPWGLALGAGVVTLGLFAKAKADAKAEVDAFTAAIERDSGVVGDNTRAHAAQQLEAKGVLRTAQELRPNMALGGAQAATALDEQMRVMAAIATAGGKATAENIAAQLQIGVDRVAAIAEQYGVKLAKGVDPILVSLGRPGILAGTSGRRLRNSVQRYAKGGVVSPDAYALATGGLIVEEAPAAFDPTAVHAAA